MLSREENQLLTRVGRNTPMGALMRCYWLPALLSEEIPTAGCPPVRVRLLGEDLVAFRDTENRIGLLAEHCAHRGTSLYFGRNEECGLRCIYHGWKFDTQGNVLETPAEPAGSDFKNKIKHTAYPCQEVAGMIFTYMGEPQRMPLLPRYEWVTMPMAQTCPIKSYLDCNYLQGIEGDFDSSHTTFLHANNIKNVDSLKRDGAPTLEIGETPYGMRAVSIRKVGAEQIYVRTSPYIMPSFSIVPGPPTAQFAANDIRAFRFWVPIDDEHSWLYILNMRDTPFTDEERSSFVSWVDQDYRRLRNLSNDYLIDREYQRTTSFSGIKAAIPAEQDGCATETMGPIYDRTREHLGYSDKTIVGLRRLLLDAVRAVQGGAAPPHVVRDVALNDFSRLRSLKGLFPMGTPWQKILAGLGPHDG